MLDLTNSDLEKIVKLFKKYIDVGDVVYEVGDISMVVDGVELRVFQTSFTELLIDSTSVYIDYNDGPLDEIFDYLVTKKIKIRDLAEEEAWNKLQDIIEKEEL